MDPSILCDEIPAPIKEKLLVNLDKKDVKNLCQTKKSCNKNFCQNNRLWSLLIKKSMDFFQDLTKIYIIFIMMVALLLCIHKDHKNLISTDLNMSIKYVHWIMIYSY